MLYFFGLLRMRVLLWFFVLVLFAPTTPTGADNSSDDQAIPTRITSERLRYSHKEHKIEFIGEVRVDRPIFQLRSERLIVFLRAVPPPESRSVPESEDGMDNQVDIEKMIAIGKVFLKHEGRVGRGDMATYWVDQGVLRLEGSAMVEEGSSKLEGNVITIDVQERGVDVQGQRERRVEGMFFLPGEQEGQ